MAFWLGVYPSTFLRTIDPAVDRTVAAFKIKYQAGVQATDLPKMLPEIAASPASPEGEEKR
jgi:hypothetical protein